jgi:hypothetical protein
MNSFNDEQKEKEKERNEKHTNKKDPKEFRS